MKCGDLVRWKPNLADQDDQMCLWCAVPYVYAKGQCPHCVARRSLGVVIDIQQHLLSYSVEVKVRFPNLTIIGLIDEYEVVSEK
tara:strand:- start:591 stop:842 length:252 start_codon:yes stop_codon:yes gene_type:complete